MFYQTIDEYDFPLINGRTVILKERNLSCFINDYPFIFEFSLEADEMIEIARWCEENITHNWLIGSGSSGFINEIDAMAFKLAWIR